MELRIQGVNVFNPLEGGKKQALVDALVSTHGEQHRKVIQERMDKTEFVFMPPLGAIFNMEETLSNFFKQKKKDVYTDLYSGIIGKKQASNLAGMDIEGVSKLGDSLQGDGSALTDDDYKKVGAILQGLDSQEKQEEKNNSQGEFGFIKYTPDLTSTQVQEQLKDPSKKEKVQAFVSKTLEAYERGGYKDTLKGLEDDEKRVMPEVKSAGEKTKELIELSHKEKHDLLVSKVNELYSKKQPNGQPLSTEDVEKIVDVCGSIVLSRKNAKNSQEFYNSKKQELADVIKKFEGESVDLEDFDKVRDVVDGLCGESVVDEYKKLSKIHESRMFAACPVVEDIMKKAKSLDLQEGTLDFAQSAYYFAFSNSLSTTMGETNHFVTKSGETKEVIFCPWALSCSDSTIVHEAQHAIETKVINQDEKSVMVRSGFHVGVSPKAKESKEFNGENLFEPIETYQVPDIESTGIMKNESTVEYFAQKTVEELRKKDVSFTHVASESQNAYTATVKLMQKLYQNNEKQLSDRKLGDKPFAFIYDIGPDNYAKYDELAEKYYNLESNFERSVAFKEEVGRACKETGKSVEEVVMDKNRKWSPEAEEHVATHREVADLVKKIEQYKQKASESEVESGDEEKE